MTNTNKIHAFANVPGKTLCGLTVKKDSNFITLTQERFMNMEIIITDAYKATHKNIRKNTRCERCNLAIKNIDR